MRVIARKALKEFSALYPDAKDPLDVWYQEVKKESWETPAEIKEKYGTASILKESRVVFNISGNKYRLIVKVRYDKGIVFIRFIGTHKEYDKINAEEV